MEDPTYKLQGIIKSNQEMRDFEGPLSLILMLLSKNKIEIRDIQISEILDQYINYLDEMQSMDLEIASEFVQMASHLLYIKSKMLLAGDEEISELEVLMQSLEQMKAKDVFTSLQKVIPTLKEASELGCLYYSKLPEPVKLNKREYEYKHDPYDLMKALLDVYSRGGKTSDYRELAAATPQKITYGVKDKSRELIGRLKSGDRLMLKTLYSECRSRSEVVATFISILELCSMGNLVIDNSENGYSIVFAGSGDTEDIIDRIEE